jgi:putative membrane protein
VRATRWIQAGLCAGLLLSRGVGFAKTPSATPMERSESDQAFLKQALGVNELELQLGRLAAERASTSELRAMGQKMVQKHTDFGQQLSNLAKQSGVSGTAEMSPEQLATFTRVQSQSGAGFDAAFKQTVDAGHVKELAMYRDEVSRAANPKLRALAERRVKALQQAMGGAEQSKTANQ